MICDREFADDLTASLRQLRTFGSRLCRDPSRIDDLVQQTALQAWAARHQFRAESSLRTWLCSILRNCYFHELNVRKFEVDDPHGALACSVAVTPQQDVHCQLADVDRALQALPSDQREALTLVALRGLSYRESGEVCKCKVGTVKSRVFRARETLLRFVDAEEREPSRAVRRRRRGAAVRLVLRTERGYR